VIDAPAPELPPRALVLLSVQRALLGRISTSLRGVTVGWSNGVVRLRFYFDGPIRNSDREWVAQTALEVMEDFLPPWRVEEEVFRMDAPLELEGLEAWAYLRGETTSLP
jgi:hypothetical protein